MKLAKFYARVINLGAAIDPRVKKNTRVFADTAILYGSADTEVKKILAGIDIEASELLLADRLREKEGLDLVLAHHPEVRAWAALSQVMQLQVDLLKGLGVQEKTAQRMLDERMREVERRVLPSNHMRSVDVARLLDLPFMCAHTPADNHVYDYLKRLFSKEKPHLVKDVIGLLLGIPEYQLAVKENAGPRVITGNPKRPAGKICLEMTGGTEGPKEAYDKLYKSGVRTLVCMHLSEEHFKKVKEVNLNVVIAGHISSDNLGLNLLLDNLEQEEEFEVIGCSGFRRIKHKK